MAKSKKKTEFDKRVLHASQDFDYKHKLSKEELDWLKKFIREEYSNDHSKPDSLYRKAFGDKYENGLDYKNCWGKKVSIKQELFTNYNEKMRDFLNVAKTFNADDDGTENEETDMEKRIVLSGSGFNDLEEFVDFDGMKEDKTSIHSLLKHYSYIEVLDLLKADLLEKILKNDCNMKLAIDNFTNRVILLAYKAEKIQKRDEKITQNLNKKLNQ